MITLLFFLFGYHTILVENPIDSRTISIGTVTAYTSEESQTDSTPFITASNQKVRDGIVANNCLAFGTKVEIAGKTYEVQDRKNKRYGCDWYDIWFESKEKALKFGIQELIIKK